MVIKYLDKIYTFWVYKQREQFFKSEQGAGNFTAGCYPANQDS